VSDGASPSMGLFELPTVYGGMSELLASNPQVF
jgi:hypothetical protein